MSFIRETLKNVLICIYCILHNTLVYFTAVILNIYYSEIEKHQFTIVTISVNYCISSRELLNMSVYTENMKSLNVINGETSRARAEFRSGPGDSQNETIIANASLRGSNSSRRC